MVTNMLHPLVRPRQQLRLVALLGLMVLPLTFGGCAAVDRLWRSQRQPRSGRTRS